MRIRLFFAFLLITIIGNAQYLPKYDSTLKIGKVGYRISCYNKVNYKNSLTIKPIGFKSEARDVALELKGRVISAEIDDLNMDGFPEVVIYMLTSDNRTTILCISSKDNERMVPIIFPDITNDANLSKGYRGQDEFKLVEGVLFRKFPIFETDTTIKEPTNKLRQIMYRVTVEEQGALKFKVLKSFDLVAH